jgi:hypothetical protein
MCFFNEIASKPFNRRNSATLSVKPDRRKTPAKFRRQAMRRFSLEAARAVRFRRVYRAKAHRSSIDDFRATFTLRGSDQSVIARPYQSRPARRSFSPLLKVRLPPKCFAESMSHRLSSAIKHLLRIGTQYHLNSGSCSGDCLGCWRVRWLTHRSR